MVYFPIVPSDYKYQEDGFDIYIFNIFNVKTFNRNRFIMLNKPQAGAVVQLASKNLRNLKLTGTIMGVTCLGRRRHVGTVSTPVLWGGAATCACPGLNTTPTGHCTTSPATPGRPTAINCKKEAYISTNRNSSIFLKIHICKY